MRVLSIDGGGYLGLATASFICEIERRLGRKFSEQIDLFCGTSTGAIIALALAVGDSGEDIVELYREFGPRVFGRTRLRWLPRGGRARFLFPPIYDDDGLRGALDDFFGDRTLGDVVKAGRYAVIPAFNLSEGRPRIFKTDHAPDLKRDSALRLSDVARASAAAPLYFQPAIVRNTAVSTVEAFCDGGVVANHPALLGLAEAIYTLEATPSDVRLLSISTPRTDRRQPQLVEREGRLRITDWLGLLPGIGIDGPSNVAHELAVRLNPTLGLAADAYERVKLANTGKYEMDDVSSEATEELCRVGVEAASDLARVMRITNLLTGGRS